MKRQTPGQLSLWQAPDDLSDLTWPPRVEPLARARRARACKCVKAVVDRVEGRCVRCGHEPPEDDG